MATLEDLIENLTKANEPIPKKKVKMYSPIYRNNSGIGYFMEDGWSSSKSDFDPLTINPIVGWQEMEVEVDE